MRSFSSKKGDEPKMMLILLILAAFAIFILAIIFGSIQGSAEETADVICTFSNRIKSGLPLVGSTLTVSPFCKIQYVQITADDWSKCDKSFQDSFKLSSDSIQQSTAVRNCAAQQVAQLATRCWKMNGQGQWDGLSGPGSWTCFTAQVELAKDATKELDSRAEEKRKEAYTRLLYNEFCTGRWTLSSTIACESKTKEIANSLASRHENYLSQVEAHTPKRNIDGEDYIYEETAFKAFSTRTDPVNDPNLAPVWHFKNSITGSNLYMTPTDSSKVAFANLGYTSDDSYTEFIVSDTQTTETVPIYHLWNPKTGDHMYVEERTTIGPVIRENIAYWTRDFGYKNLGIAFYAYPTSWDESRGDLICPASTIPVIRYNRDLGRDEILKYNVYHTLYETGTGPAGYRRVSTAFCAYATPQQGMLSVTRYKNETHSLFYWFDISNDENTAKQALTQLGYKYVYSLQKGDSARIYTTSESEKDKKFIEGYLEKPTFFAYPAQDISSSLSSVTRQLNPSTGDQIYTADEDTYSNAQDAGYTYSQTAFYAYPADTEVANTHLVLSFRNSSTGMHFYALSDSAKEEETVSWLNTYIEGVRSLDEEITNKLKELLANEDAIAEFPVCTKQETDEEGATSTIAIPRENSACPIETGVTWTPATYYVIDCWKRDRQLNTKQVTANSCPTDWHEVITCENSGTGQTKRITSTSCTVSLGDSWSQIAGGKKTNLELAAEAVNSVGQTPPTFTSISSNELKEIMQTTKSLYKDELYAAILPPDKIKMEDYSIRKGEMFMISFCDPPEPIGSGIRTRIECHGNQKIVIGTAKRKHTLF